MTAQIAVYLFSLCLLGLLLAAFHVGGELRTHRGRIFLHVITAAMILLVSSSTLEYLRTNPSPSLSWLARAVAAIYYSVIPLSGMFLAAYAEYYLGQNAARTKRIGYTMQVVALINILVSIASIFTGWYFVVTGSVYSRGALYPLVVVMSSLPVVVEFIRVIVVRKRLNPRLFTALAAYLVSPILAGFAEAFFSNLKIVWDAYVFSIMVMYLYLQSNAIGVDFLTGLGDMRDLEMALHVPRRRSAAPPQRAGRLAARDDRSVCVLLFDIDDLKLINVQSGRAVGDEILVQFSRILKSVFPLALAIVRTGGDGFVVLQDAVDDESCGALAKLVRQVVDASNLSSPRQHLLSVTAQWGIFDPDGKIGIADFILALERRNYAIQPVADPLPAGR